MSLDFSQIADLFLPLHFMSLGFFRIAELCFTIAFYEFMICFTDWLLCVCTFFLLVAGHLRSYVTPC